MKTRRKAERRSSTKKKRERRVANGPQTGRSPSARTDCVAYTDHTGSRRRLCRDRFNNYPRLSNEKRRWWGISAVVSRVACAAKSPTPKPPRAPRENRTNDSKPRTRAHLLKRARERANEQCLGEECVRNNHCGPVVRLARWQRRSTTDVRATELFGALVYGTQKPEKFGREVGSCEPRGGLLFVGAGDRH